MSEPQRQRADPDIIVVGAGIVGVCVALHLQARGRSVVLVDRKEAGSETSSGNAGLIELSTAFPHPCPRDAATLLRYAFNRSPEVRYRLGHLPAIAPDLFKYWRHSAPRRIGRIGVAFRKLVAQSLKEHEALSGEIGADALMRRGGWLELLVSEVDPALVQDRISTMKSFGISARYCDPAEIRSLEPSLTMNLRGALHWPDTVGITDPGGYVKALADHFVRKGGVFVEHEARALSQASEGWTLHTATADLRSRQVVVALGPWSADFLKPLGYHIPMLAKRGYHMHYRLEGGAVLNHPVHIPGSGYLLSPMRQGVRLTTGIELAARDAPDDTTQIDEAERKARALLPLGERLDSKPWRGTRPCMPDMLPVLGRAPRHRDLWLALGHGHHGFTLGPVTGRLLAEMICGEPPCVDPAPYAADHRIG